MSECQLVCVRGTQRTDTHTNIFSIFRRHQFVYIIADIPPEWYFYGGSSHRSTGCRSIQSQNGTYFGVRLTYLFHSGGTRSGVFWAYIRYIPVQKFHSSTRRGSSLLVIPSCDFNADRKYHPKLVVDAATSDNLRVMMLVMMTMATWAR